jgi:hypothetical protein
VLARLFLALNGHELRFDAREAIAAVLALAAGKLSEKENGGLVPLPPRLSRRFRFRPRLARAPRPFQKSSK